MDAPRVCHHLGNEFSFFNIGRGSRSLREAIWPGAFPAMWGRRCIGWFGLESLLETSQAPTPRGKLWSGCRVRWALGKTRRDSVSQLFKPASFSVAAPIFQLNFWAVRVGSLSSAWEISTRLPLPLGETGGDERIMLQRGFCQLRGSKVYELGSYNARTCMEWCRGWST